MLAKTHSTLRLTDHVISGLPYAADSSRRIEHWDSVLPGLVLRIGKRSKTFYQIGTVSGSLTKHRLGRFPGMGVERARALAETRMKREVRARTRSITAPLVAVKNFPDVELLTTKEAAILTKMSAVWYEKQRGEGLGPPYYQKGREVRYAKPELLRWWLSPHAASSHALMGQDVEIRSDEELLTTVEAAAITKMSVSWFEKQRYFDQGPPYLRRGRTIRYLRSELMTWWRDGSL